MDKAKKPSATERLAGHLLGQPLTEWVAERRESGDSWDECSTLLREKTKGEVSYHGETLRTRYGRR